MQVFPSIFELLKPLFAGYFEASNYNFYPFHIYFTNVWKIGWVVGFI